MMTGRYLADLIGVAVLLGGAIKPSVAQIFPSDNLTSAFERQLSSISTAAFVSACYGPGEGEACILVIPIGSDTGTLTLLVSGKVYNGAGVRVKDGRVAVSEGGGGEWSLRKLQFFADRLGRSPFELEFASELRDLRSRKATVPCPTFHDPGR